MAQRIEIVAYNNAWQGVFREIAGSLRDALGDVAVRIDHIGSTAVPGLPAKDIIDLQVTVVELDVTRLEGAVGSLGYSIHPEIHGDHIPPGGDGPAEAWAKIYLVAPVGQRPTHVHVRKTGNPNQRYPILFRDYLRAHPAAIEAYALIKRALARLHPEDKDAYYDVKDPVCDLIIQAAEQWAETTGWTQPPADA